MQLHVTDLRDKGPAVTPDIFSTSPQLEARQQRRHSPSTSPLLKKRPRFPHVVIIKRNSLKQMHVCNPVDSIGQSCLQAISSFHPKLTPELAARSVFCLPAAFYQHEEPSTGFNPCGSGLSLRHSGVADMVRLNATEAIMCIQRGFYLSVSCSVALSHFAALQQAADVCSFFLLTVSCLLARAQRTAPRC